MTEADRLTEWTTPYSELCSPQIGTDEHRWEFKYTMRASVCDGKIHLSACQSTATGTLMTWRRQSAN